MKKINIRFIAESAIISALYVALTWLLAPISYGAIQFRLSEILLLLVVLNPKYAYALIVGCFVANTTSVFGWYDMVFGTLATVIAILPMLKIKRLELASIFPVISNAFIISLELLLYLKEPHTFGYNVLTIGVGEAVVLYLVGIPVMYALKDNQTIIGLLDLDTSTMNKTSWLTPSRCVSFIMGIFAILFYIAYPLQQLDGVTQSALSLTKQHPWLLGFAGCGLLHLLVGLLLKGNLKDCILFIIGLCLVTIFILSGIYIEGTIHNPYYYGYILYIIIDFILLFYLRRSEKKNGTNRIKKNTAPNSERS